LLAFELNAFTGEELSAAIGNLNNDCRACLGSRFENSIDGVGADDVNGAKSFWTSAPVTTPGFTMSRSLFDISGFRNGRFGEPRILPDQSVKISHLETVQVD